MATSREKQHYESQAEHHTEMAKRHKSAAANCSKEGMDALAKDHEGMSESHAAAAENCIAMCKMAAIDEMNKATIVPDGVSAIPRNFGSVQVQAIPRPGAPMRPIGDGARPNVPIQFEHLIKVEHVD